MLEQPDAASLLRVAAQSLEADIVPQLTGKAAYDARITARLIAIVAREIEDAGRSDQVAIEGMRKVLGRDDGDLPSLTRDLAERLRAEELSPAVPQVAQLLWSMTMAKLAIDQPSFPRYRQLRDER